MLTPDFSTALSISRPAGLLVKGPMLTPDLSTTVNGDGEQLKACGRSLPAVWTSRLLHQEAWAVEAA